MKLPVILALIFSSVSLSSAVGTSAGNFLLKSPNGRPAAMAEAFSALDAAKGGIAATFYNPAASVALESLNLSFLGQRGVAEDNYGALLFGFPSALGSFSGSLLYYGMGDIDLIDTQGNTRSAKAEQDLAAGLSYSDVFLQRLATGIGIKIVRSTLIDSYSANAIAFDFGAQYQMPEENLSFGLAVQNLGSPLKYLDTDESLPFLIRAGGAYALGLGGYGKALLALDLLKVRNDKAKELLGLEYWWNDQVAVRGGYKFGQDSGKLSFGAGFALGRFVLDYAITENENLGLSHSASFTMNFENALVRRRRKAQTQRAAARPAARAKTKVAVLSLQPQGVSALDAAIVSDELRAAFARRNRRFDLIGQKEARQILQEKFVNYEQCNEGECAIDIGRQLKAEKVVLGNLGRLGTLYVMSFRMIDTLSGQVVLTETVKTFTLEDIGHRIKNLIETLGDRDYE